MGIKAAVTAGAVVLFLGGAAVGGYLLAEHTAPVAQRAMAAYKAGDYATALPLLKKWAALPEIRNDKGKLGTVMTYVVDAQQKLQGKSGAAMNADALKAQALAVAADQNGVVAGRGATTAPAGVEIDPSTGKARVPHPAPVAGQVAAMTIKQLGNFDFDPNTTTDIPADVKAMDGTKVRLRGFMIPLTQAESITEFALVPSLVGCCFGQPPGVQHTITCKTEPGKALSYTVDEISVEGTLRIRLKRDQDYTYSVFEMEVGSASPVQ